MRGRRELFGHQVPGNGFLHRAPAGVKVGGMVALTLVVVLVGRLPVSLVALAAVVGVLLAARLPARRALGVPLLLVALVLTFVAFQAWTRSWVDGVIVAVNVLIGLYASRAVLLTTPTPEVIDVIVWAATPLRIVRIHPERVGLAAAVMLRSIPYVLGSFDEVRATTRARGIERNPLARITPVVIDAVAYAHATGDALAARGLGEGDDD